MTSGSLHTRLRPALAVALGLALAVAACGGGEGTGTGAPVGRLNVKTSNPDGKRGGTLKISSQADVDYLDPGQAYYQFSYMILSLASQRPLYTYEPGQTEKPSPDTAASDPEISENGKTVTIRIRKGIRFSPPVDREVTSEDVKYAIERGFLPSVANGYVGVYFADISGVEAFEDGDAEEISGIQTPDDQTIVFKLDRGTGAVLAGALSLPISTPVPKEYAQEYDQADTSEYGLHQVFTGPYMIENDSSGKLTGYSPGRFIKLKRNPNWDPATDFRPAYLDGIEVREGQADPTVGTRQILQGRDFVNGDYQPRPAELKSLLGGNRKEQLTISPSGGNRYISLKMNEEPFDDINVRKAVVAAFDRDALRLAIGGRPVGSIATHFIPPGIPGFEEAGGMKGPDLDFLAKPQGDMELARDYMRRAGYESGTYSGEPIDLVADSANPEKAVAEIAIEQFRRLGFRVRARFVARDTMNTKFCDVPENAPDVCPNVGWAKDFNDAQTILGPTFDGDAIVPQGNSNWPLLDIPKINRAMDEAALLTGRAERAEAWGAIDRMITAQAPAVPVVWDSQRNVRSENVVGVYNVNNASFDPAWISLE